MPRGIVISEPFRARRRFARLERARSNTPQASRRRSRPSRSVTPFRKPAWSWQGRMPFGQRTKPPHDPGQHQLLPAQLRARGLPHRLRLRRRLRRSVRLHGLVRPARRPCHRQPDLPRLQHHPRRVRPRHEARRTAGVRRLGRRVSLVHRNDQRARPAPVPAVDYPASGFARCLPGRRPPSAAATRTGRHRRPGRRLDRAVRDGAAEHHHAADPEQPAAHHRDDRQYHAHHRRDGATGGPIRHRADTSSRRRAIPSREAGRPHAGRLHCWCDRRRAGAALRRLPRPAAADRSAARPAAVRPSRATCRRAVPRQPIGGGHARASGQSPAPSRSPPP